MHPADCPAAVRERAARVRLACFDVDGTLTNGHLSFDSEGRETKAFHVHDGLGLTLLRAAGIEVAFITARTSPIVARRGAELGLTEIHMAVKDKFARVAGIASRLGLGMDEVSFMGDDLPDLRVMLQVGFAVAPASAHPWLLAHVHWHTSARAGHGAARELCDLLLAAQDRVEGVLERAGKPLAATDATSTSATPSATTPLDAALTGNNA